MTSRSSSVRRARPLLGTIVEIEVRGVGGPEAHAAIDAAFAAVEEVQRRMSFHDPLSTLSELNRHAALRPVRVDEWSFEVLSFAAEVHRVSSGIFDISIAPALVARGFLPDHHFGEPVPRVAGFDHVQLGDDRSVRFHDPAVCLDLGGIAKGFAVDQAIAVLRARRIPSGLVNAGGDLRAFGEPMQVSIRHPAQPGATLAIVELNNAAFASSAHYFADRLCEGATVAPIVHPATGESAEAIRGASVKAPTAMAADALTKVVMLAGEDSLPVLEHFGAEAIFVAGVGQVMCSAGWNAP